jgi:hypothetical protein
MPKRSLNPDLRSVFSALGSVLFWVGLLFVLPRVVEALAAAQVTPSGWGQFATIGVVLYFVVRLIRWAARRRKPSSLVAATGSSVAKVLPGDASTDRAIARHEAAHAVVAYNLGVRVNLVTIVPDHARRGRNELDWSSCAHRGSADVLFDLMTVCIASAITEQDQVSATTQYGVGPDEDLTRTVVAAARIIALGVAPAGTGGTLSVDHLVAAAGERARGLLTVHSAALDATTDALLEERTIDSQRVVQLAA